MMRMASICTGCIAVSGGIGFTVYDLATGRPFDLDNCAIGLIGFNLLLSLFVPEAFAATRKNGVAPLWEGGR